MLDLSLKSKFEITVTNDLTAEIIGSGTLPVLATPSLALFMEKACVNCVEPHMDAGMTTVGTSLNLTHTSATPVGMKITCECTLTEINGKLLTFDVEAYDECGIIGHCVHERFIVNSEKFMKKALSKLEN